MDTSKYIKKCPRCGTEIEPERCATTGDKVVGGITGASGAAVGFAFGGPIGAGIGAIAGYFLGRSSDMSISDDYDENQWFQYKCDKCGCTWKEKIHTNDNPDDPTWLINNGSYH